MLTWGLDTLPSQKVPQKCLKNSISLHYFWIYYEVMAFFDYLSDISIESQFWNSNFVQKKIAKRVK